MTPTADNGVHLMREKKPDSGHCLPSARVRYTGVLNTGVLKPGRDLRREK